MGLVNPTSKGLADNITVSLYYAGLAPGATVVASVLNARRRRGDAEAASAASTRFVVGRDPAASLFDVVLPVKVDAFSYAAVALSLVEVPVATRWRLLRTGSCNLLMKGRVGKKKRVVGEESGKKRS